MPSASILLTSIMMLLAPMSELYQSGMDLLQEGRYGEAREKFVQVREESPDPAEKAAAAYHGIVALRLARDYPAFERDAEAFIAANEGTQEAIALEYDLIRNLSTLGYYADAAKLYEHFVAEHPSCPEAGAAVRDLGWLQRELNQVSEAVFLTELALEVSEEELLATYCEILRKAFYKRDYEKYVAIDIAMKERFGNYMSLLPTSRSYGVTGDPLSVLPQSEIAYMMAVVSGSQSTPSAAISLLDAFIAEYPRAGEAKQAEITKAEVLYRSSDLPGFVEQLGQLQRLVPKSPELRFSHLLQWEREQRETSSQAAAWSERLTALKASAVEGSLPDLLATFWGGCRLYDESALDEASAALQQVIAYEGEASALPAVADLKEEARFLALDILAKKGQHEAFLQEASRFRQDYPDSVRMGDVRFAEACSGLVCDNFEATISAVAEMRSHAGPFENNALIDALDGLAKNRLAADIASASTDAASTASLTAQDLRDEASVLLSNYLEAIGPPPSTIDNPIDANLGLIRIEALFELGDYEQMLEEFAAYTQDYTYREKLPLAQAYLFAGIAMTRMDPPDYARALECFDKSLALEFPEPNLANHVKTKTLGWALLASAALDDAERERMYLEQLSAMPETPLKQDLMSVKGRDRLGGSS